MHTKEPIVREDDLAALEQAKLAGYELRDYRLGPILWTLAALTALAIAGFALMFLTFKGFENAAAYVQKPEAFSDLSYPSKPETQHRLTVDLDHELAGVREESAKNIEHYSLDTAAGRGRIPVDRALELIAEKGGLPVFTAGGVITFPDRPVSDVGHGAPPSSPAPGFQPQFEPEVHQAFPEGQH